MALSPVFHWPKQIPWPRSVSEGQFHPQRILPRTGRKSCSLCVRWLWKQRRRWTLYRKVPPTLIGTAGPPLASLSGACPSKPNTQGRAAQNVNFLWEPGSLKRWREEGEDELDLLTSHPPNQNSYVSESGTGGQECYPNWGPLIRGKQRTGNKVPTWCLVYAWYILALDLPQPTRIGTHPTLQGYATGNHLFWGLCSFIHSTSIFWKSVMCLHHQITDLRHAGF